MPKAVFRPQELHMLPEAVAIEVPVDPELSNLSSLNEESLEDLDELDVYTGPSIEDLRREAEEFKAQVEEERQAMIEDANFMAENLVKKAEEEVAREVERKNAEAMVIVNKAREDAERIIADAHVKAAEMEMEVNQTLGIRRKEAIEAGRESGRKEGYEEGKAEVERLLERTHTVLQRAQDKRADILAQSEQEIVDLVLLLARKVIKIISENQKNVIIANVVAALRKIRTKGDIIIRVNIADLKLTTEHTKEFIKLIEGVKAVQVIEDSSVGPGGCIIETDFGEIDARISSQLAELEDKILDISPITARKKTVKSKGTAENDLAGGSLAGVSLASGLTGQEAEEDIVAKAVSSISESFTESGEHSQEGGFAPPGESYDAGGIPPARGLAASFEPQKAAAAGRAESSVGSFLDSGDIPQEDVLTNSGGGVPDDFSQGEGGLEIESPQPEGLGTTDEVFDLGDSLDGRPGVSQEDEGGLGILPVKKEDESGEEDPFAAFSLDSGGDGEEEDA